MEPLVSVIIPTYNRADLVAQAVQSVLEQIYGEMEIIVVDDGSTDNTPEVLKQYEGRIIYIQQERCERSKARNEGFRHSKGDYVAFLDSDDFWLPTKVDKQVQILDEHPDVGVVYTDLEFVDIDGLPYAGDISWDEPIREVLYEDLMTHNVVTGSLSSIMVRRECLDKVGLFDESMTACEDLDLYRRLARYYKFYKIDLPLVKVRLHDYNTQRELSAMVKGWQVTITKILQDTPAEFEHYKYEAIVKILSQIARLHRQQHALHAFFLFCVKSALDKPNWILRYQFWKDLISLSLRKIHCLL